MNTYNTSALRAGMGLLLLTLITATAFPYPAEARSRYSSETWNNDSSTFSNELRRSRYSSATQKAIDALDSDSVEKLPIPILLGVTQTQLSPNFGDPRDGGARTHEGEDIMAPRGSIIVSPTDAVVIKTGTGSSAGNYVYTANPGGEVFAYMHLDRIPPSVKQGTVLEKGDLIGYVGNTGAASGTDPHLHLEIRKDNKATDPYPRLTREFTLSERIASLKAVLALLIEELKYA